MVKNRIFVFVIITFLVSGVFSSSFVLAQTRSFSGGSGTSSFVNGNRPANANTYYGPENRLQTYWPVLGNKETCLAREDIVLQVAPIGCQPAVVRSDLLAEQNVPVFCQLDSLKLNPLLDIDQIRNIRFTGDYPPEVVGAGFHPARAALRTHDKLLGSPLVNNIGYVVVVLKQQPREAELPESVSVELSAQIEYLAGNALGVGRAEFILEKMSDEQWETEKLKQSFWDGRYFVRLEEVDSNFATVSIYSGDRRITTHRVEKGKATNEVYLPGLYCQAGLSIEYEGFVSDNKKASIEISTSEGVDRFDVNEGSVFHIVL